MALVICCCAKIMMRTTHIVQISTCCSYRPFDYIDCSMSLSQVLVYLLGILLVAGCSRVPIQLEYYRFDVSTSPLVREKPLKVFFDV